jgi:hypothetical protein
MTVFSWSFTHGINYMGVSWNGTLKSSMLDWDFPSNKPSSYWGTPIYGNHHIMLYKLLHDAYNGIYNGVSLMVYHQ